MFNTSSQLKINNLDQNLQNKFPNDSFLQT